MLTHRSSSSGITTSSSSSQQQQQQLRRTSLRKKNHTTLPPTSRTEENETTNYGSDVFLHLEDIQQESEPSSSSSRTRQNSSKRGSKRKRNNTNRHRNRIIEEEEEEFQTPSQVSSSQDFEPSRQTRRIQSNDHNYTTPSMSVLLNNSNINNILRVPPSTTTDDVQVVGDNNSADAPIVIEDDVDVYRHHGNSADDAIVLEETEEEVQQPTQSRNSPTDDRIDLVSSMIPSTLLLFQQHPFISSHGLSRISALISSIARLRASIMNERPSAPVRSNNLTKIKYQPPTSGEKEECTICLCEFEKNEKVYKTGCGHMYHVRCLDQWFRQNTNHTCPNCRSHLVK